MLRSWLSGLGIPFYPVLWSPSNKADPGILCGGLHSTDNHYMLAPDQGPEPRFARMDISDKEMYRIERDRIVELLKHAEHPLALQELQDLYADQDKTGIKLWKSECIRQSQRLHRGWWGKQRILFMLIISSHLKSIQNDGITYDECTLIYIAKHMMVQKIFTWIHSV